MFYSEKVFSRYPFSLGIITAAAAKLNCKIELKSKTCLMAFLIILGISHESQKDMPIG